MPSSTVLQEMALLYELALATGTSVDPVENSRRFVRTLLARKNLTYAAVWVRADAYDPADTAGGYRLIYAHPGAPGREAHKPDHPARAQLARTGALTFALPDPAAEPFANGRTEGALAILPLGGFGHLVFYDRRQTEPFARRFLAKLRDVIETFARSLAGCLAHAQLERALAEREQAEAEVRRLKLFYEQILDAMPAQLAVFTPELRYAYVTPSAIRDPEMRRWVIGRTDADYTEFRNLGRNIGELRMQSLRRAAEEKRTIRFEETFENRKGERRHFVRFVSPVLGSQGQVVQILGYGLDITDRVRAEEALLASEVRYKHLVEEARDLIYEADLDGQFTYVNPVARRLFGYEDEPIEGVRYLNLVRPDYREEVEAFYAHQFAEQVRSTYFEFPAVTRDGRDVWIGQNVQLVVEGERPAGVQAVARDITERKRAEAALIEAKAAAEASSRAKEQFLANMSHEIRTPLNAVIGMAHLLDESQLDPRQRRYLDAISFSADTLLHLINDILDFAKIDAGMLLFERVPFDLRRLLENLADTFRFKADEQRLRLNLDLGTRVPAVVSGDPVRLRQVLGNLLSNAVKFTEAGYVTLRARCVAEDEAGTRVRIEVEDTGIGISADQLGAVFESFTQARSDTTRKYGGTGLGLAIVRALVEGQGGTLGVQSTEGEGSTFAVELTFGRSEGEVPARIEADETDIAGVRVLLVEDNRVNQLVATEMLRGWGAQVEVAHDGREGVEHALAGTYDLVLMDVQMPEMDGYEATRRIRAAGRTELPIIALTASALVEQRRQAEAAGMDDFVMKPFDPADLRRRIAFYAGRTDQRPDAAPPATPAFDLDVLRRHVGGDESFLEKMLVVYRQEWPPLADELLAAGEAADWPRVVFAAHKAKANAALLGAADLAEQLRQIESAAEAGPVDVAAVRDAVDEMRAVVDALHA